MPLNVRELLRSHEGENYELHREHVTSTSRGGYAVLKKRVGGDLDYVFFTNSGTYAKKAFHGLSHGALSVNGDRSFREGFEPLLPHCRMIPFDDVAVSPAATPCSGRCPTCISSTWGEWAGRPWRGRRGKTRLPTSHPTGSRTASFAAPRGLGGETEGHSVRPCRSGRGHDALATPSRRRDAPGTKNAPQADRMARSPPPAR